MDLGTEMLAQQSVKSKMFLHQYYLCLSVLYCLGKNLLTSLLFWGHTITTVHVTSCLQPCIPFDARVFDTSPSILTTNTLLFLQTKLKYYKPIFTRNMVQLLGTQPLSIILLLQLISTPNCLVTALNFSSIHEYVIYLSFSFGLFIIQLTPSGQIAACNYSRFYIGRAPYVLITDLDMLKQILVKDFNNYMDHAVWIEQLCVGCIYILDVVFFSLGCMWSRGHTSKYIQGTVFL